MTRQAGSSVSTFAARRASQCAHYQMFDRHVAKKLTAKEVAKRLDVNWRKYHSSETVALCVFWVG